MKVIKTALVLGWMAAALCGAPSSWGGAKGDDVYDAAVANPHRPAEDRKRDASDRPANVLRLAQIRPGMTVGDYLAAGGYYSELLSYIVGPKGHVLLFNNPRYDAWSNNGFEQRLQGGRLPNVEHRSINLEHLDVPDKALDAMIVIKVYHDLYWVDDKDGWPKIDTDKALSEMARVIKLGGTLVLVDHSAKPGTGSSDAGRLHRIDEDYARTDFEHHGFHLIAKSDVLRRPDDPRDALTYQGPMVGKTDRFVLVFHRVP
jgi:predicted methyltransferase